MLIIGTLNTTMKFKGQGKINICGFEYKKKIADSRRGGGSEHPKKNPVSAPAVPTLYTTPSGSTPAHTHTPHTPTPHPRSPVWTTRCPQPGGSLFEHVPKRPCHTATQIETNSFGKHTLSMTLRWHQSHNLIMFITILRISPSTCNGRGPTR